MGAGCGTADARPRNGVKYSSLWAKLDANVALRVGQQRVTGQCLPWASCWLYNCTAALVRPFAQRTCLNSVKPCKMHYTLRTCPLQSERPPRRLILCTSGAPGAGCVYRLAHQA